jgi:hypothetical protein
MTGRVLEFKVFFILFTCGFDKLATRDYFTAELIQEFAYVITLWE